MDYSFDLIFIVRDVRDEARDQKIAEHVIQVGGCVKVRTCNLMLTAASRLVLSSSWRGPCSRSVCVAVSSAA